ncbi:MAG: carbon monoxide dehydrogenase [Acidimicrobiia bacterium]|nr:carbon monoxide dehydrogenase [Acidimicrobiia bacterium]MYC57249.1 carbon monoxide dehydrogenase [Acidimicrobiia bacterium]MYG94453.1 carbon monoxide dehydrogenase [Acidimicrobiia bacterium]MYI30961.1 carbon monoxide dehydrogenase [Acidimicrobiia bacterium]
MEISNEIEVNASIDDVWRAFNDVERMASCLPGAQLTEIEGDEYRGVVKVKVGPVNAQYKGKATFLERDEEAHKVVILAEGREARGQGNASAQIAAVLTDLGDDSTKVGVTTDLKITGKVAQIGRNLIPDVSVKIMGQFAGNLEGMLSEGNSDEAAATSAAEGSDQDEGEQAEGLSSSAVPEAEAVNLLAVAGPPVAKRVGPFAGLVAALWLVRKLFKRKKRRRA